MRQNFFGFILTALVMLFMSCVVNGEIDDSSDESIEVPASQLVEVEAVDEEVLLDVDPDPELANCNVFQQSTCTIECTVVKCVMEQGCSLGGQCNRQCRCRCNCDL